MGVLRKDLRAIAADGTAANVMVGIGENYFPAFVLALSGSQLACGLSATLPMVVGGLVQLLTPVMVGRLRSYRRWIVWCSLLQAAAFLPLLVAAIVEGMPLVAIFGVVSVYWATGQGAGSAWNTWVGTLIPSPLRARYFARRTRLCQLGLMIGFMAGGIALQLGMRFGAAVNTFALLFCVAGISRLVSAFYLAHQREPWPPGDEVRWPRAAELSCWLRGGLDLRVLLYMLAAQMAVQISAPYFTPFMFVHLELSYAAYAVLICAAYLAKVLCLPMLGGAVQRWGAYRLLWAGGLGIAIAPGMWVVHDNFAFLLGAQILSGVAWAAYELAMLLLFFEAIPSQRRVGVLTLFNLANALAIFAGAVIGGTVLSLFGATRGAYLTLFAASAAARAGAVLMLAGLPALGFSALRRAARSAPRAQPLPASALDAEPLVFSIGHWRIRRDVHPEPDREPQSEQVLCESQNRAA